MDRGVLGAPDMVNKKATVSFVSGFRAIQEARACPDMPGACTDRYGQDTRHARTSTDRHGRAWVVVVVAVVIRTLPREPAQVTLPGWWRWA